MCIGYNRQLLAELRAVPCAGGSWPPRGQLLAQPPLRQLQAELRRQLLAELRPVSCAGSSRPPRRQPSRLNASSRTAVLQCAPAGLFCSVAPFAGWLVRLFWCVVQLNFLHLER